jgi:glycyl-tRNA synthetase
MADLDMDELVSLCKKRGFIFQSSEVYGGIGGFWDYGPLGVELKRNVKEAWWQDMVRNPPPGPDGEEISMVGLDCSIIMNPRVWEASGHVAGFSDPMVDCKKCRKRYRADKVWVVHYHDSADPAGSPPKLTISVEADSAEDARQAVKLSNTQRKPFRGEAVARAEPVTAATEAQRLCPDRECAGPLTEPRNFNLMFQTHVGALQDSASVAYLRPETAQGIFANFKNVLDSTRLKLPFGIAQIGKAFRNEITPRNYTFRSREFEQMEIEFFCHPDESRKWYDWWRQTRLAWYTALGIRSDRLRPREQGKDELAHYSVGTTDIEYLFPFSDEPQELEGVAHRGDFDLSAHQTASKKDLAYFDEELWQQADKSPYGGDKKAEQAAKARPPFRFVPHVIEPSAGADRFTLAVLCEAFTKDTAPDENGNPQERLVLKFHPRLAPVKAAIFPLVKKDGMPERAERLYRELKAEFAVFYDESGAVGRRYRRQDEIGTPFCITVDGQTAQDETVTLRNRDSLRQTRVKMAEVASEIRKRLRLGADAMKDD